VADAVLCHHHARGLTSGVRVLAGTLTSVGHTVHVPDLYEGKVLDDLEQEVAHARQVGLGTILDRAGAAADPLPAGCVLHFLAGPA
jgi:dienelactone hydrolase